MGTFFLAVNSRLKNEFNPVYIVMKKLCYSDLDINNFIGGSDLMFSGLVREVLV